MSSWYGAYTLAANLMVTCINRTTEDRWAELHPGFSHPWVVVALLGTRSVVFLRT